MGRSFGNCCTVYALCALACMHNVAYLDDEDGDSFRRWEVLEEIHMKKNRNYDLTKLLKTEHWGKWIALSADQSKVIGLSNSFKELENKLGRKNIVYMKAPERGVSYAF